MEEEKQVQEEDARKQEAGGKLQEARGKSKEDTEASKSKQHTAASKRWKKNATCKNKKAARKKLESTTRSKLQEAFLRDAGNVFESQRQSGGYNLEPVSCRFREQCWAQAAAGRRHPPALTSMLFRCGGTSLFWRSDGYNLEPFSSRFRNQP